MSRNVDFVKTQQNRVRVQVLEVVLLNFTLKKCRYRYKFIKNLIFLFVIIILFIFIKNVLTCEIKWNKLYSDNAHMYLIATAAIA